MIRKLTVGTTFWYEERKYHVVAVVVDGDHLIYVLKYFGIHKRWWHYEAMEHLKFKTALDCNLVKNLVIKQN